MQKSLKKFIIQIIIIVTILLIIGAILFKTILIDYYSWLYPVLLIFFSFFTLIFHYYILRHSKQRIAKFLTKFLAVTSIKLFLYVLVLVGVLYFIKPNTLVFVSVFMLLYIIFTIFEVKSLRTVVKKNS